MDKVSQREVEMEGQNEEMPSARSLNDAISDRTSTSNNDPDTMLGVTVLLLACLSLAVLAHAVM
jgi:hypothetical protein